ncbi:hypothetical protein A2U01_0101237, partial [Trifolium medium]|nr:hypothetical protein [Trifolium medium]
MRDTSLHHTEPSRPPTAILPASSPYRADNTRYHIPPLSTNNNEDDANNSEDNEEDRHIHEDDNED